jgi:transposase
LTVAYLDECGFSPSQPTTYSWTLPGERKQIPYENPRSRRVNAIGVLLPWGEHRSLWWDAVARPLTAEDVLVILEAIPRGPGPLVVVLDNASIHISHLIRHAAYRLREQGIHLYFLPAYSPELNRIEPVFGVIKHYELPERTYATVPDLKAAIHRAFRRYEDRRFLGTLQHQLRPAA